MIAYDVRINYIYIYNTVLLGRTGGEDFTQVTEGYLPLVRRASGLAVFPSSDRLRQTARRVEGPSSLLQARSVSVSWPRDKLPALTTCPLLNNGCIVDQPQEGLCGVACAKERVAVRTAGVVPTHNQRRSLLYSSILQDVGRDQNGWA